MEEAVFAEIQRFPDQLDRKHGDLLHFCSSSV